MQTDRTPAESKTSSTGNQQETPDCSDRQPAAALGLICGFSFILTKAPFNYKMEICQTQTAHRLLSFIHLACVFAQLDDRVVGN